eukprot:CAMPEP_0119399916 /NCGR_PEP_ID=MMETSP1334-20130426/141602_1 /TAXON_ID=127549 /ORGANISM="Calcidiscus leptoporus, Strain RCC1130" /LENGTH=198 /DNA_ID=CAMNT_0007423815 /DNA_START=188 /DNA_END=782 /DNA_ORIENTATION=-
MCGARDGTGLAACRRPTAHPHAPPGSLATTDRSPSLVLAAASTSTPSLTPAAAIAAAANFVAIAAATHFVRQLRRRPLCLPIGRDSTSLVRDRLEIWPRHGRDTAEIPHPRSEIASRYDQDVAEIQPRFHISGARSPRLLQRPRRVRQDAETWPKHGRDMAETWPRYGRDMAEIHPRSIRHKALLCSSAISARSRRDL